MENGLFAKSDQFQYMILDPFNHTYNPGRNAKALYPRVWQDALISIYLNGLRVLSRASDADINPCLQTILEYKSYD